MTRSHDVDEETIELIIDRVVAAVRDELQEIANSLVAGNGSHPLTVGEVAQRFGVARSTVYAHWREWGGYKLGAGEKAAIRFPSDGLPEQTSDGSRVGSDKLAPLRSVRRMRRSGTVLPGEPRLPSELDPAADRATPRSV